MPRILSAWPSALIAAREGMSANAFYRELQQLGMGARRSEVLSLFKAARSTIARSQGEPLRPISEVPTGGEIGLWPTKNATGFGQTVTLTYRDNTTGHISQVWWRNTYEAPVTREQAVNEAIDAYSPNAESYNQTLIGAAHTSTNRYQPISE